MNSFVCIWPIGFFFFFEGRLMFVGQGTRGGTRGHPYLEQDIPLNTLTLMNQQGTVGGGA